VARNRLLCASVMAGLAMNLSEAGTDHSLAHALGVRHGLAHGLSVGLVLAEALDHDRRYVPERCERIADALGEPPGGAAAGARAVRAVRRMLARVGCPALRDCGVADGDVEPLTELTLAGWIPIEPGPWTREDVAAAFRAALDVDRGGVVAGA
jgi:alcohol dehydrogenase